MADQAQNPFAPLFDEFRRIVREEISAALTDKRGPVSAELLKISDAAKRLNQSKDWCYRHWREIGGKKLGNKSIRFTIEDLEKYLSSKRSA